MKGVRFYLEYQNSTEKNKATRKNPGNHTGNVFAAFVDDGIRHTSDGAEYDGLGSVYARPNSPVETTAANIRLLAERCLRISEEQARKIHPELFAVLDKTFPPAEG